MSTTFTVLDAVVVFPAASLAEYVIVYVPRTLVSTVPDTVTVSPPSDVAPASVYVEPSSTVAGLSPLIVITGNTESTGASFVSISEIMYAASAAKSFSIIESSRDRRAITSSQLFVKIKFFKA